MAIEVKFISEIDYYREALALMFHAVNGVNYNKLKDSITIKFHEKERKKLIKKLSILNSIQEKVIKVFNLEDTVIQFFFKGRFSNSGCIGSIIMESFDDNLHWINKSVEERKAYILSHYEEFIKYDYDKLSVGDSGIEYSEKRKLKENQSLDLVRIIDEMQCSDEERWQLLKVLKDFPRYMDKFFSILDSIAKEVKKYSVEIERMQRDFIDEWEKYLKENNISDVIKRFINIDIDVDDFEHRPIYIGSQIFSCYNITLRGINDQYKDFYKFVVGIIFYGDFDINYNETSKEIICSGLKLLGDSSKYELLQIIKNKSAYGQELAKELNLTTATISHHVNALCSLGFIKVNKSENRIYYEINKETIEKFLDNVKMALLK